MGYRAAILLGLFALWGCGLPLPDPAERLTPPVWRSSEAAPDEPSQRAPEKHREDTPLPVPPNGVWSLESCVNRALAANRNLLDSEANLLSAEYSIAAAKSVFELKLFPNASASATRGSESFDSFGLGAELTRQTRTGTRFSLLPSVGRSNGLYTGGLVASVAQPLLRGRQTEFVESGVRGAEFAWRTSRRNLYRNQVDTVLATVRAVYLVVQLREALRLNEESAQRSESHVQAARARERAGLSNSLDVYRAVQEGNRSQDAFNSAREAFGDAVDSLRILLALPLTAPLSVDAPLRVEDNSMDAGTAIAIALKNRIELDQAEDDLEDSLRRSRVASINTQPDLDLVLSLAQFGEGDDLEDGLKLGGPSFSLALASTTDFARTAQRAQFAQSRLIVDLVRRRFDQQRDQVIREVRQTMRDLERDTERIRLQEGQVDQAEGKLRVARIKFERGVASNFDVIEAEGELRAAETSLIAAVTATIVDGYSMRAVLGTLLERPASF